MRRRTLDRVARAVWICVFLGSAQRSVWAGRPLDTEDTATIAPGHAELEFGNYYARDGNDHSWTPVGVLGVGLTEHVEARIEGTFRLLAEDGGATRAGMGDTRLGVKWRLLDERSTLPAVLVAFALHLPTGDADRGLGAGEVETGFLAGASKVFGSVELTANGGYTPAWRNRNLDVWVLAGSAEYAAARAVAIIGEAVSAVGTHRAADLLLLRAGPVYELTKRTTLDAAVAFGATHDSPDFVFTTGVTISLY